MRPSRRPVDASVLGIRIDAQNRAVTLAPFDRCSARVSIQEEADVAMARKCVRQLAPHGGLSVSQAHALATAVSEIAHNIVIHAGAGDMTVQVVDGPDRQGLIVVARDTGPGILDVGQAMQDGYSTVQGLGLGLSSARRLVDDFELVSAIDHGTTVILRKWAS